MNHDLLRDIFNDFREMKRGQVSMAIGEDRDIPMMVFVGDKPSEDNVDEVACILVPTGGRDEVCATLAAVMARMFIPYWVAICSDGYVAKDADVPEEFMHPGGLIEMAAAGHANVKECLTITAADHTGALYANSQTYWYDDDGDIWFDDDDGPGGKMSGPMLDVLLDITSLWGKTQAEIIAEILNRTTDMN